jgi:hypothetical protein
LDSDIPPDELAAYEEYKRRVEGTNISAQTLLATDYLNHFNEIVMLLDMLPDMPDMIEECKVWEPKSYKDHFANSTFSDRQLAVEAYDRVPGKYRRPFEETIGQLNDLLLTGVDMLDRQFAEGVPAEQFQDSCRTLARTAQTLMDCASAIIHGSAGALAQSEIDGLMGR